MTALTFTANRVSPVNDTIFEAKSYKAGVEITAGQWLTLDTATGKAILARANAVGTARVIGMAMRSVGINQPVPVLRRGAVSGADLTALSPLAQVFVSAATAGSSDDTAPVGAGNVVNAVARVDVDASGQKYLWVESDFTKTLTALS